MSAEQSPGLRVVAPATAALGEATPVTGRIRHDEKITVYLSLDELHALEIIRLELARSHGMRVDRGRIVREALAHVVADFQTRGPRSALVKRLRES